MTPRADPTRPYQLSGAELASHLDDMVAVTFSDLTSQFMILPRGPAFITYEEFLVAYEALRLATDGFEDVTVETCWRALYANAAALIVLRAVLGLSPPEWEELAREEVPDVVFPAGWARTLDGVVKRDHGYFVTRGGSAITLRRTTALLNAACKLLAAGAVQAPRV